VQLGFLPRVTVKHTSHTTEGQIYVPEVNWGLAIACLALVLAFKESGKLAAAYGIAVTGTMGITSVVYFVVVRKTWGWSMAKALPLLLLFLAFDLPFFGANILKFFEGGYVPMVVAVILFFLMVVWKRGRAFFVAAISKRVPPLDTFLAEIDTKCVARVPGTAVFLTSSSTETPPVLMHHVQHNKVLHRTVILLTVSTVHVPRVSAENSLTWSDLGHGFHRLVVQSGFMQTPNIPAILAFAAAQHTLAIDFEDITYYLGRETFLATDEGEMGRFTETLFGFMARNATPATAYFGLPPDRVVEIGLQIDL
jgi:KUP system potassium uptake protein